MSSASGVRFYTGVYNLQGCSLEVAKDLDLITYRLPSSVRILDMDNYTGAYFTRRVEARKVCQDMLK